MKPLTKMGNTLRANPRSYVAMPTKSRREMAVTMRPDRIHGFDVQQAEWIYSWFLEVTSRQLETLQEIHPRQYAAREAIDGTLYLSAALLTDAVDGRRLRAAESILTGLTMRHISDLEFPEIDNTEPI